MTRKPLKRKIFMDDNISLSKGNNFPCLARRNAENKPPRSAASKKTGNTNPAPLISPIIPKSFTSPAPIPPAAKGSNNRATPRKNPPRLKDALTHG